MAEPIKISPRILISVASIYSDPHRVLMEYIDNSIDAAEVFYDNNSNCYTKNIEIEIIFDGVSYEYARIIIQDNCTGINNLEDLITNVGESPKINDQNTNGQFGLGIYSFLAICDKMIVTTRLSNSEEIKRLELNSKIFETCNSENLNVIEEEKNISGFCLSEKKDDCWTRFKLESFKKDRFKELSPSILKEQIENHFESILNRKNIIIKITDKDKNKEHVCQKYDYSNLKGEEYNKELEYLEKFRSKRYKSTEKIKIDKKIIIYLKVSKDRVLNRKPVFVIKGRKIAEVSNVKAFRTYSKGSIWSHPNVTGFIDVTGVLEPTISRDDFKPSVKEKALFHTLSNLEAEIKEFITNQLKLPSSGEYKFLEQYLSDTLRKITENKRFKNLFIKETGSKSCSRNNKNTKEVKEEINLKLPKRVNAGNIIHEKQTCNFWSNNPNQKINDIYGLNNKKRISQNKGIIIKESKITITHNISEKLNKNRTSENTELKKDKTGGINILIDSINEPPLDKNNNRLRSNMVDGQIIIYKNHPMFEERVRNNCHGVQIISNELIFYVAVEIMTQIKIMVFKEKNINDKEVDEFFNSFNNEVYSFLNELSKLEGKNLNKISR